MNLLFLNKEYLEYALEKTYNFGNSYGHHHNEMLQDFDDNVKWDMKHFASYKLQFCLKTHTITHIYSNNIPFENFRCFQSINQL
jgi:hypothetical protein